MDRSASRTVAVMRTLLFTIAAVIGVALVVIVVTTTLLWFWLNAPAT